MELFLAVAIGIAVIVIALGLAFLSNRAEETRTSRRDKNVEKKTTKSRPRRKRTSTTSKALRNANSSTPTFDGQDEEDDEDSMLDFLKGTQQFQVKEAKEERKKKAKADKKAVIQSKEISNVVQDSDDDVEYVLIKRKKIQPEEGSKKKNKKNKNKDSTATDSTADQTVTEAVPTAEGDNKERRKRQKDFFKRGLDPETIAAEEARKARQLARELERAQRKEQRQLERENPELDQDGNIKRRPRQQYNGDDQDPERPRRVREAPPPPPKPLSGPFESASLDDMLSSLTAHYGSSSKPKETFFSKLPRTSLMRILSSLSARDVIAVSRVNRSLSKVCRDEKLWRGICERDFNIKFSEKNANKKRFKSIYKEEYLKSKKATTPSTTTTSTSNE